MGYWSSHPMCGDLPMDYKGEVTDYAFSCLKNELETEESTGEKNINISKQLREFADTYLKEEYYYEHITSELLKDLFETYKYEIINNYLYADESFVVPFMFLENGIKVKKDYVKYLKWMLVDGNASERGYSDWNQTSKDHPMFYVSLMCTYAQSLFNEENSDLSNEDFLKEHHANLDCLVPKGLLETLFNISENDSENGGLINTL